MGKEQLALQALEIYPDKVRLVYHHYPDLEEFSYKIAEALEAADAQGRFLDLHDRIIDDVPEDITELKAAASDLGLDMEKFNESLDSGEFRLTVELDKQKAIDSGVKRFAMFINSNEFVDYPGTLDDLRDAIDKEMEAIEKDEGI